MITAMVGGEAILIDDEDAHLLANGAWLAVHKKYVQVNFNGEVQYLHRIVSRAGHGYQVDHKNMNTHDNRKENLRVCTKQENMRNRGPTRRNTSGFKGVHYFKRDENWRAYITASKKTRHLGYFPTPELAHEAYCEAAKKYHGEFARFE